MNVSELFIRRPIATSLLALAILLAGMVAYTLLPVAPLPQIDLPPISVSASLPGASPLRRWLPAWRGPWSAASGASRASPR